MKHNQKRRHLLREQRYQGSSQLQLPQGGHKATNSCQQKDSYHGQWVSIQERHMEKRTKCNHQNLNYKESSQANQVVLRLQEILCRLIVSALISFVLVILFNSIFIKFDAIFSCLFKFDLNSCLLQINQWWNNRLGFN